MQGRAHEMMTLMGSFWAPTKLCLGIFVQGGGQYILGFWRVWSEV